MTQLDVTPTGNYDNPFSPGDSVRLPDGELMLLPTSAGYHVVEQNGWRGDTKIEVLDDQRFCVYFHVMKPK